MTDAPILILAYNRPDKFKNLLDQLIKFKVDEIYISIDGPKNEDDQIKQSEIHQLLKKNTAYFKIIKINQLKQNVGLQKAVTSGIDWFFENVDAGIILEDDLVLSSDFIPFCQELLIKYKKSNKVMAISGDNYFPWIKSEADYFFSRHAEIWGWATWKRAWVKYQQTVKIGPDLSLDQEPLKSLLKKTTKNQLKLAMKALSGDLDSWAYIWNLTMYLNHGLCIIPRKNLVTNNGFGENSTHTKFKTFHAYLEVDNLKIDKHPKKIVNNKYFDKLKLISDNKIVMLIMSIVSRFKSVVSSKEM